MKNNVSLSILVMLGILTFAVGCSTSGGTVSQQQQEKENFNPEETWTLRDHLRRATGVRVTGSEGSTRVIIRGESSMTNPGSQPLFVIDGQRAGRNFSSVEDMLNVGEINYIEVLPPSKATQYGMDGNFGVIRIHTKSNQS